MRWFPSHIANFLFFILKVPKCEIFVLQDFRDFYTMQPPWIDDLGTVIKNSKLFCFGDDFEVFSQKIQLLGARSKNESCLWLLLNPFASFQKDFTNFYSLDKRFSTHVQQTQKNNDIFSRMKKSPKKAYFTKKKLGSFKENFLYYDQVFFTIKTF